MLNISKFFSFSVSYPIWSCSFHSIWFFPSHVYVMSFSRCITFEALESLNAVFSFVRWMGFIGKTGHYPSIAPVKEVIFLIGHLKSPFKK